jgi:hypothetical protein
MAKGPISELGQVFREAWDNIGDTYQQVVLGVPRFPQHHHAPEPENESRSFGGRMHSTDFTRERPPKALEGEILPPEKPETTPHSPDSPTAGSWTEEPAPIRIHRTDPGDAKLLPGREPDRGMDFDR